MNITQAIAGVLGQPITHQLLLSWLKDYKQPNDKINALKSSGVLMAIKRGIYIAGPELQVVRPENALLANHLLGPSYVSLDAALAFWGMIPERVYTMASVTTQASRSFETPVGLFTYSRLPLPYYAFGIKTVEVARDQSVMMAGMEKALCDKIVLTRGVNIRSLRYAEEYLLEDLRLDEELLRHLDLDKMRTWLRDAPKRNSLEMVINWIASL